MKKIITETKTVIINTRNDEQFVSAEESIEVNLMGESKTVITLTREDGTTKNVAESTFKRYFKQTEITVETEIEIDEPKPSTEVEPQSKHQVAAMRNTLLAYQWVKTNVPDGNNVDENKLIKTKFNTVYKMAMRNTFEFDSYEEVAPIYMKLAGKEFVKGYIAKLFNADGWFISEALYKADPKDTTKKSNGQPHNHVRTDEAEKTVVLYAFTGMLIGTFAVVEEDEETCTVIDRKNRTLIFSKDTGKQINACNPNYANYIAG